MAKNLTAHQIWTHFNEAQKSVMAKESLVTKKEFFAEPQHEQKRYYNWMINQAPGWTSRPIWD